MIPACPLICAPAVIGMTTDGNDDCKNPFKNDRFLRCASMIYFRLLSIVKEMEKLYLQLIIIKE